MPPVIRKLNKFFHSLFGIPYIWVDMKYLPKTKSVQIEFDYNQAMVVKLAKAGGYDTEDPNTAIQQYISECFHRQGVTQDFVQPLFDDDPTLPHEDERR